jgi:hypothetical protein
MAATGGLTRPALAAANPVMLLRIALIAGALAIWQAVSMSACCSATSFLPSVPSPTRSSGSSATATFIGIWG